MKNIIGYQKFIAVVMDETKNIVLNLQDIIKIDEILNSLTDKEASVVRMHYGMEGNVETLKSIALYFKVTPPRIGQIFHKAMRKLHHPSRKKIFEECINSKQPQMPEKEEDLIEENKRLKKGIEISIQLLKSLIPSI